MRSSLPRILLVPSLLALSFVATSTRASAPPTRYTYPASGTVFDTATRLTWQRAMSDTIVSQADAIAYCSSLDLAGGGWRLPTAKEMLTLVDYSVPTGLPMIDGTAFPMTPAKVFWSATALGGGGAVNVWFQSGGLGADYAGFSPDASLARCVR
ncbi:MAG TPA: DUF1566 domain-containing protein [Polyangia bacterium]|nr:DUF1566 domain-containing protein [Polyangia bacterium]